MTHEKTALEDSIPKTMKRHEQKEKDTWDLSSLFPSLDAWEKAFNFFETCDWTEMTSALRSKDVLSADEVKKIFDTFYEYERRLRNLYTYAHLLHDQDTAEDRPKQAYKRVLAQCSRFSEAFSWIEPKLLTHSEETLRSFIQSPLLSEYKTLLERTLRQRPHTLNEREESILAMAHRATGTGGKAFRALSDADLSFQPALDQDGKAHEVTHASYGLLLRSSDRTLRKNAFYSIHNRFQEHENTLTELLSGEVEQHRFNARVRNYQSSIDATLFPKSIPVDVYRSLIKAVRKNLPALHEYMSFRKSFMKLDELHMWDLYAPLLPEVDIRMSYNDAVSLVLESVQPLGDEYVRLLQEGLTQKRWVDRYENSCKRSGAYSSGSYDSYPYILMNYKGILRDVFTLAHEAGHSMHSELSKKNQPYHYSDYEIFVAEVASTFNEAMLAHTMIQKAKDNREKAFIINEKLEDIRATLFRQTMFAEFELFIHETIEQDKPLTPSLLKEYYYNLNKEYFGDAVTVDPEIAIEWARIPHFYYNFYVYQYATGISAALTLFKRVIEGGTKERDQYLSFLKGGASLFPLDLLKVAGIDMTTPKPVEHAAEYFSSLLTQFKSLA